MRAKPADACAPSRLSRLPAADRTKTRFNQTFFPFSFNGRENGSDRFYTIDRIRKEVRPTSYYLDRGDVSSGVPLRDGLTVWRFPLSPVRNLSPLAAIDRVYFRSISRYCCRRAI